MRRTHWTSVGAAWLALLAILAGAVAGKNHQGVEPLVVIDNFIFTQLR